MSVFEAPSSEASWPGEAEQVFTAGEAFEAVAGELEAPGGELESPFRSAVALSEGEGVQGGPAYPTTTSLESPFQSSFSEISESESTAQAFRELLAELEDEQFDEAVAHVVDEAAGLHLSSGASWSSSAAAPGLAMSELEAWIEPLRQETHRMLDNMAERLGNEELETLRDSELEALFESLRPDTGFLPEAFENFLGGLFKKATSLVSGAVKLAKQGVGGLLSAPIKFLLGKLQGLAGTLLRGVLQKAIGLLPGSVQPIARQLAARLLGEAEAEAVTGADPSLARQFDIHAASLMLAESEAEAENVVMEAEAEAEQPGSASLAELDDARARLAGELTELPAGHTPVAELEQFLPVLMAARPAIKLGLNLIGRDNVKKFLADRIAGLIKGLVGPDAARLLSPPLVDVGLSALGLEAEGETASVLGGEALASTVEETVNHVLELPAEAFEDTLRMEAEIQEAFAEAAARNIPAEHLRPDLPQLETAAERGVWVLMPRAARPRYRYKKYSRVFLVPITRQVARAIATADGGSVETMLRDRGVSTWPVNAEVHLYETLPGATHLGHIAQFESEGSAPMSETLADLNPLTPEAASLLVREPGLGRPLPHDAPHHHHSHVHEPGRVRHHPDFVDAPGAAHTAGVAPASSAAVRVDPVATHPATSHAHRRRPLPGGSRYFRLQVPGKVGPAAARPRRRVHVTDVLGPAPTIRVHIRLSEAEAQRLAELLQGGSLPATLAWLKHCYQRVLPAVATAHILNRGPALFHAPVSQGGAVSFALEVTERVTQALSAFVHDRQAQLTAAVQSSAQGLTLAFSFKLAAGGGPGHRHVPVPEVTVRPGHHDRAPGHHHRPHTTLRRHAESEGLDGEYGG
jgi:hypothetical protein